MTATTSPHGSKSAGKADWRSLAGREVVLLPDNDDSGRGYADDVAAILAKLTPTATVRVVELADLPKGGDAVEYIEAQHAAGLDNDAIRAELEHLADVAKPIELTSVAKVSTAKAGVPVLIRLADVKPEAIRCRNSGPRQAAHVYR